MTDLTSRDIGSNTHLFAGQTLWGVAPHATLESGGFDPEAVPQSPRLVVRSARAISDAESSFAAWSGAGWTAFERSLADTRERVARTGSDAKLLVWPGVGSVLSDAVSTLTFARKHPAVGILADPAAWITSAMEPDAEDHLARFAHALSLCETLEAVVVRPVAGLDRDACRTLLGPAIERAGAALA